MWMFSICSDVIHSMSCLLSTQGSEQAPRSPQMSLKCLDQEWLSKEKSWRTHNSRRLTLQWVLKVFRLLLMKKIKSNHISHFQYSGCMLTNWLCYFFKNKTKRELFFIHMWNHVLWNCWLLLKHVFNLVLDVEQFSSPTPPCGKTVQLSAS